MACFKNATDLYSTIALCVDVPGVNASGITDGTESHSLRWYSTKRLSRNVGQRSLYGA